MKYQLFVVLTVAILPSQIHAAGILFLETPGDDFFARSEIATDDSSMKHREFCLKAERQIAAAILADSKRKRFPRVEVPAGLAITSHCQPIGRPDSVSVNTIGGLNSGEFVWRRISNRVMVLQIVYDSLPNYSPVAVYIQIDDQFVPMQFQRPDDWSAGVSPGLVRKRSAWERSHLRAVCKAIQSPVP